MGRTKAYIALGSNLGDSRAVLKRVLEELEKLSAGPLARSSFWRTAPVDCPPGSPDFLNAAAMIEPLAQETPESLLRKLQDIERRFGRRPKEVLNEARPLDLDLVAFGEERRDSAELRLPHPRAHLRRFVLEPLAEIAPELVLPGQSLPVRALLNRLSPDEPPPVKVSSVKPA